MKDRKDEEQDEQTIRDAQRQTLFRASNPHPTFLAGGRRRSTPAEKRALARRRSAEYRDRLDRAKLTENGTLAKILLAVMVTSTSLNDRSIIKRFDKAVRDAGYDPRETRKRLMKLRRRLLAATE